jgi:hypothetical protein
MDRAAVEQFMGDYFQGRTSALRRRLGVHHRFWQRFYDNQCQWDSRRGVVEKSEAERIVSISPSPAGAWVITSGETIYRSRYDVRPNNDRWLIHEVDMECGLCRVKGLSKEWAHCSGTGWMSWKNRATLHGLPARNKNIDPNLEIGRGQIHNVAIEQFMAEHFRERTLAQKQELELLAAFAGRFCHDECEWTRWGPSIQSGQAERILNIAPLRVGVRVISSGFTGLRLRYHLRPEENSWLIQQVDPECLHCYRNGPSSNCFLCGGTIWDRKRLNSGQGPSRAGGDEPPADMPRW